MSCFLVLLHTNETIIVELVPDQLQAGHAEVSLLSSRFRGDVVLAFGSFLGINLQLKGSDGGTVRDQGCFLKQQFACVDR